MMVVGKYVQETNVSGHVEGMVVAQDVNGLVLVDGDYNMKRLKLLLIMIILLFSSTASSGIFQVVEILPPDPPVLIGVYYLLLLSG